MHYYTVYRIKIMHYYIILFIDKVTSHSITFFSNKPQMHSTLQHHTQPGKPAPASPRAMRAVPGHPPQALDPWL